jgi:hypothetical protein
LGLEPLQLTQSSGTKKVKGSKPKYAMTEIMNFDGQQVLLKERTEKKFIQDLYINDYKYPHPFVAMVGTALVVSRGFRKNSLFQYQT